jgi:CDGSH-type Zn-finger protein
MMKERVMPYKNEPTLVDETEGLKYYCTCGESANKPYCDGSHETQNTGKLPREFKINEAKQVAVCDCGKTGTSPFCDGSHSKD